MNSNNDKQMLLTLLSFDKAIFLWCNRFQQRRSIIRSFRWISRTGDGYLYGFIGLLAWASGSIHAIDFFKTGLIAFLFEIPLFILLKKSIRRDRPFVTIEGSSTSIKPADKFSLPSGHSTAAFVMAGLISIYYPLFAVPALMWAGLIGISRVMLGVHYPTDILAGAVLGLSCTMLAISLPI